MSFFITCVIAEECKRRWKNLRDCYRRDRQKQKELRRSGSAATGARPWQFAEIMGFLDPFMEERPTSSNMSVVAGPSQAAVEEHVEEHEEEQEQDEEGSEEEHQQQEQAQAQAQAQTQAGSAGKKRQKTQAEVQEGLLTVLERISNRPLQPVQPPPPPPPPEDADSLFFKCLLEEFKTLNVRTKQHLKLEFHRLVFEAQQREDPWGERAGLQLTTM